MNLLPVIFQLLFDRTKVKIIRCFNTIENKITQINSANIL